MIRLPGIEQPVESLFIIEVAIAPVDRQFRRCETGENRAGGTLDHPIARSGNDDDQLVTGIALSIVTAVTLSAVLMVLPLVAAERRLTQREK